MPRLAIVASHPIQYQVPLYRRLSREEGLSTKVFFCWDFGIRETFDPGFGQNIKWDVPLLEGFDSEMVPNLSPLPGTHHPLGLVNPGLIARLKAWAPDAIILHGYTHCTVYFVVAWARRAGIPILLRGETNLLSHRAWHRRWVRGAVLLSLFRQLAGALAIGTLNRDFYLRYGVPQENIFLAPYTVDNAFFQERVGLAAEEAAQLRGHFGISARDTVVLYAAKLIRRKRCAELIEAFAARPREGQVLVIAGDGPEKPGLLELASRHPHNIRFMGFVNQSQMPSVYALGDLFVLPSLDEPWGLAVNEAMNMSCPPLVSSEVGSWPDLVNSDTGWVFAANDLGGLERALTGALSDTEELARRGRGAFHRISSWGIEETALGTIDAVRKVITRRA